jgi:hypothetical protein
VLGALDFALAAEDRSFGSPELRANLDRLLDRGGRGGTGGGGADAQRAESEQSGSPAGASPPA